MSNNRTQGSGHNLEHKCDFFFLFFFEGDGTLEQSAQVMESPSVEIFKTCLDFPVKPALGSLLSQGLGLKL